MAASFWLLAILLGFFLFAASAPSALYGTYAKLWNFSATTVTAVYAVYAAGALTALLTTGRLSDHLGRRPVVMVALFIQAAGMLAFIAANGVASLYLGRVLQGVGTGVATGAISAWLVDLQPPENPRRGSLVAGIALLAGLGGGALGSGLLVQYASNPLDLVFWLLIAVYVVGFLAMPFLPDVVPRGPGWLQSMRPQVGVPPAARSQFAASAPSLIAMWGLAALYLSLGPSLLNSLVRTNNRTVGVLVIVALMTAGALASALFAGLPARPLVIRGSLALVLGVGISLIGILTNSSPGLFVGSAIAGVVSVPHSPALCEALGPLPRQRSAARSSPPYTSSFTFPSVFPRSPRVSARADLDCGTRPTFSELS